MSTNRNEENDSGLLGRVDTDAAFDRFKGDLVKCPTCNQWIEANRKAIKKHFGRSHEPGTPKPCEECNNKIFVYIMYEADANGERNIPREIPYHECIKRTNRC